MMIAIGSRWTGGEVALVRRNGCANTPFGLCHDACGMGESEWTA